MKEKITNEESTLIMDILNVSYANFPLEFHNNFLLIDKSYKKLAQKKVFRENYPHVMEHFKRLRVFYSDNRQSICELEPLLEKFDNTDETLEIANLKDEIKFKLTDTSSLVRAYLENKINIFTAKCHIIESNVTKINNDLSKDQNEILKTFYEQIVDNDVLFKSKVQKEQINGNIEIILGKMELEAHGLIIAIITSYHLQSILTNLPNLKKTQFDYSVVIMELHKAVEKSLNALMISFVKSQEDISTTIPKTKRSFYKNGQPDWLGISVNDKILFMTDDVFKRIKKLNDIQKKYITEYTETLKNWAQTRNEHMHTKTIHNLKDLDQFFKKNLKVFYILFELMVILNLHR